MNTNLTAMVGVTVLTCAVACSHYTSATDPSTFRGCLQGDTEVGFSLLTPTGDGSGTDAKGQMMTYKVVPAAQDVKSKPGGEQGCRDQRNCLDGAG